MDGEYSPLEKVVRIWFLSPLKCFFRLSMSFQAWHQFGPKVLYYSLCFSRVVSSAVFVFLNSLLRDPGGNS